MRRLGPVLLFAFCTSLAQVPSGIEILGRVEETFRAVEDYTVTLDIVVDLERLNVPPMHVTMYFKQPDKVHFSSEGFALLPREGISMNPSNLLSKYDVEEVRQGPVDGGTVYHVTLKLKTDRTGLRRVYLTVDGKRFLPVQLESPLLDGRTMTARFTHAQVQGLWLPAQVVVTFSSNESATGEPSADDPPQPSRSILPRTGTISVRYSDYKVNTGLRDEMFEQPAE